MENKKMISISIDTEHVNAMRRNLSNAISWLLLAAILLCVVFCVSLVLSEQTDLGLMNKIFAFYACLFSCSFVYLAQGYINFTLRERRLTFAALSAFVFSVFFYVGGVYTHLPVQNRLKSEKAPTEKKKGTTKDSTNKVMTASIGAVITDCNISEMITVVAPIAATYEYGDNNPTAAEEYIKRYKSTAKAEENLYGIPAAITLAQGILESGAGTSRLARVGNNHFGVKGTTEIGHVLVSDDKPNEKFKKYPSAWHSFRDHSKVLLKPRYKELFKSKKLEDWVYGLKRCGYATEKNYGVDLIRVIRKYKLDKLS